MKKFVESLHGLRGIASVMVLVAHITGGFYSRAGQVYSENIQDIISNIGVFGVEIFFILSGYVIFIASQKANTKTFFKHRFWRIYPLFFALTLVYYVGNSLFNIDPLKNDVLYLVSNLLFLDRFLNTPALTPNAWSLTFEVWYYFITFIFVSCFYSKRLNIWLLLAVIVFLFFIIYYPITIYFVLGVLLAIINTGSTKRIENIAFISGMQILSFVSVAVLSGSGVEFGSEGWSSVFGSLYECLLPFTLFIFMYTLLYKESIFSKILSRKPVLFLGKISYSLYLIHPYTYIFSYKITEALSFDSIFLTFSIFLIIAISFSLVISYFTNRFFENLIYSHFVRKDIYKS